MMLLFLFFTYSNGFVDCSNGSWHILETLPPDLNLPLIGSNSTFGGWLRMLEGIPVRMNIAALWGELIVPKKDQSQANTWCGPFLNSTLMKCASQGTQFKLVTNNCQPDKAFFHYACSEVEYWNDNQIMDVTFANFSTLVSTPSRPAQGFLHAKVLATEKHAYSGSANLAYTSLSQTKELGLMFLNCPAMASIFSQAVEIWNHAGMINKIPSFWPPSLTPNYGPTNQISLAIRDAYGRKEFLQLYPCYSPPPFKYGGNAGDCAHVLINHINEATSFISIQAMQYSPSSLYQSAGGFPQYYWPDIDTALREAAFRGVRVRLILSNWTMTVKNFPQQQAYWRSLNAITNITVHQFRMPSYLDIPALSRVNHNKFFISEKVSYVSTSNLSPDYFHFFAGFDWTILNDKKNSIHSTLSDIFERDWNSPFVVPLFDE